MLSTQLHKWKVSKKHSILKVMTITKPKEEKNIINNYGKQLRSNEKEIWGPL